jgi:hypothetical protein
VWCQIFDGHDAEQGPSHNGRDKYIFMFEERSDENQSVVKKAGATILICRS